MKCDHDVSGLVIRMLTSPPLAKIEEVFQKNSGKMK
jgi:hypothetical protein